MIPLTLGEIAEAVGGALHGAKADARAIDVSTDTRSLQSGDLFIAIRGPRFDGHDYLTQAWETGAVACIMAEDRADAEGPRIVVRDPVAALGRLAQHHRRLCKAKVIAITGSNGKTTTKSMLAHVLGSCYRVAAAERSFNNHIGLPLTLLRCKADDDYVVAELGTNAPGEIAGLAAIAEPDIGVVTCIGEAHLEGLGGREGVRAEKMSLFDLVRTGGAGFIEAEAAAQCPELPHAERLTWTVYGASESSDLPVDAIAASMNGTEATIDGCARFHIAAPGAHNAVNAAGVFGVCRHLGMDDRAIIDALATYRLPELRVQVTPWRGATIVADCYNANPTSVRAAIKLLADAGTGRQIFVLGAMVELGAQAETAHREIGKLAAEVEVDVLITVGEVAAQAGIGAANAAGAINTIRCADVAIAVAALRSLVRAGDTVLIKGSRSARLERVVESLTAEDAPVVAQS